MGLAETGNLVSLNSTYLRGRMNASAHFEITGASAATPTWQVPAAPGPTSSVLEPLLLRGEEHGKWGLKDGGFVVCRHMLASSTADRRRVRSGQQKMTCGQGSRRPCTAGIPATDSELHSPVAPRRTSNQFCEAKASRQKIYWIHWSSPNSASRF